MGLEEYIKECRKYSEFKKHLDTFKPGEIVNGRYIKIKNKSDNHIIDCFLDMSNGEIKHYSSLKKWDGYKYVDYDFQKREFEENSPHYLVMCRNNNNIPFDCCDKKGKENFHGWKFKEVDIKDCPICIKRKNEG